MKPIPASATQRPTCSGLMSILTPSEDNTSAAPERDDSARLPCLATDTPAPATMKEAQVETLTEPEPSAPRTAAEKGGEVEDFARAGAVAAGADHVDGITGCADPQHLGAHRRYRAGDL